jgi:hypothetical protein
MDITFSTDLLKVSTERQQNHSTFKAGARMCTQQASTVPRHGLSVRLRSKQSQAATQAAA